MGRSQKALKNVTTGLFNKLIIMALAFATRTIFIRLLGAEYTGISSLYTNILSVLSLAEMGIGNVLMFYLYSALKDGDEDRISDLVSEFRNIYLGIIACVLGIGIAIVPFLQFIISSPLNSFDLVIYYLLYLLNSVASYFVIYRTMVISADQQSYIQNRCNTLTTIAMYLFQIIYLFLQKDFLGFLIIQVLCTIANNLILNHIACRKYPYLKRLKPKHSPQDAVDKKGLFGNIKATFLFKLSDKILDQTDSIIISMMFGTIFVGYYSNYYLIITYLVNIAAIIATGLLASFGNLNAEGNKERSYEMFRVAMLLFSAFGIYCTACYSCIIQDFIPLWTGSNEYVMDYGLVIAVLLVFYVRMVTNTVWMYRSSMGLFKEVQYINLIAAGLNIVFSVIFGKIWGVKGVIIATAVARLLTSFWYEGRVIFNKLGKPAKIYYLQQLRDFSIACIVVLSSYIISSLVGFAGIKGMLIKVIICTVITGTVELAFNSRTKEFILLRRKLMSAIGK